ncbi:MAG: DNA mismatch repair endonuclease MutL [Candidatus Omnitrophica bacterium]|nr:DNA mismatch repair endonuclease MutL [Candidatus Omnitrophota bacterium]
MNRIKILPKHLADKIAAGEVVERPASVVKELLENALDARSANIEVAIEDAGRSLIKVIDDGEGMNADDLNMATLRHATSKIEKNSDLMNITTLGFRGEALSSICAVSFMKIFSRTQSQDSAHSIALEAGVIKSVNESARGVGTTVEVKNLFFNTPARLKFLKSKAAETAHIIRNMNEIALAHPRVALKLLSDKEEVINCDAHEKLLQRIEILFGTELAKVLVPISFDIAPLKVRGFISKPGYGKANRKWQYIFVNKRPVSDKIIMHATAQGYHTCLMERQFPCVFIFIETPPELVDVNVHPSKREVRFREAVVIHDVLVKLIKDALTDKNNLPEIDKTPGVIKQYSFKENFSQGAEGRMVCENNTAGTKEFFPSSSAEFEGFSPRAEQAPARSFIYKKYLQIDNTYIAAQDKNGMIIIDAHAAHERVLFDALREQFKNKKVEKQKLLFPVTVHFSKDEFLLVLENKSVFDALGFEIEDFGDQTMALYAYPSILGKVDIAGEFKNIIADMLELDIEININIEKSITPVLSTIACHCAIRANQALSQEQIDSLVSNLWRTSSPYTCPHGRPTIISLTRDELQKRFKRK